MTRTFLALALLVLTTGCSSFHRDWRQAAREPEPGGIRGRWEGTWRSEATGHKGRLRCLLTQRSATEYEARFHAKYKGVLGFGYTTLLSGGTTNGVFLCSGQADLGRLAGGVYHYDAKITPAQFQATYRSKYDHGVLEMKRPNE